MAVFDRNGREIERYVARGRNHAFFDHKEQFIREDAFADVEDSAYTVATTYDILRRYHHHHDYYEIPIIKHLEYKEDTNKEFINALLNKNSEHQRRQRKRAMRLFKVTPAQQGKELTAVEVQQQQRELTAVGVEQQEKELTAVEVEEPERELTAVEVEEQERELTAVEVERRERDLTAVQVEKQERELNAVEIEEQEREQYAVEVFSIMCPAESSAT